ncbi:unnamed protein product [Candida verbasci]|uniref:WD40 repeat-like protein n=1 Tax=Candida verbasci TaxID=1227364 RepID=A0A9W4TTW1_9ASCO|nr:unnamed protein product [Candida verbasci]
MVDPFLSDPSNKKRKRKQQKSVDEELTSESETEQISEEREELSSDEEFKDENAADKRRRLAKQYLENLKSQELQLQEDLQTFDAKDLDDDILSRRLQKDVAETKGHVYKFIANKVSQQLDDENFIKLIVTRIGSQNLTSMAIHYPYLYTVSKDMEIIKWDLDNKKPKRIKHRKGGLKYFNINKNISLNNHWQQINCIAASPDGRFVVTGGADSRLIIWSSENLSCLKILETRSAVNSITFKKNSDQLYAACADLRIRTYSINQFTQLEILYGHQDNITDIDSLNRETCVSVGSRDKTVMFWKIAEESRLTFRGGDSIEKKKRDDIYYEGSIDVVSMIDETHFLTGSDNGNIALWSLAKKKALFIKRLGHDLQPEFKPNEASAETDNEITAQQIPPPQPYLITSIHAIPFSDVFVTGSFDGTIKFWKLDENLRSFQQIGQIDKLKGFVNKITTCEF